MLMLATEHSVKLYFIIGFTVKKILLGHEQRIIHISSLFAICETDTKVKLYKILCYPHSSHTRDWSSDYLFLKTIS